MGQRKERYRGAERETPHANTRGAATTCILDGCQQVFPLLMAKRGFVSLAPAEVAKVDQEQVIVAMQKRRGAEDVRLVEGIAVEHDDDRPRTGLVVTGDKPATDREAVARVKRHRLVAPAEIGRRSC